MDDVNLLVTVAYMSEINTSKAIKCLGYLWLVDIPLMGRHSKFPIYMCCMVLPPQTKLKFNNNQDCIAINNHPLEH